MHPFFKESPTETRMFPCPDCQEIISVENSNCRYCGVAIDEATSRRLNADFQQVSDAVTSANTFKESIWLAVLLTVAIPIYLLATHHQNLQVLVMSAASIGFIVYGLSWNRKYGGLETKDRDYPESVRAMRRSLLV
jgi:hypothetical protein